MNRRDAIRAVMAMPAVTSIAVAKVEPPDDVIVLECDEHMSFDTMERIRKHTEHIWPGRKVLVLDGGLKLRIVRAKKVTQADGTL